jgi:hypothetical protein
VKAAVAQTQSEVQVQAQVQVQIQGQGLLPDQVEDKNPFGIVSK